MISSAASGRANIAEHGIAASLNTPPATPPSPASSPSLSAALRTLGLYIFDWVLESRLRVRTDWIV